MEHSDPPPSAADTGDITRSPIAQRIDWLFELARRHARDYASSGSWLARQCHLARHPTAITVLKCMDGRINISVATQSPPGIIQPFRNLGGMFDLGWPHLGETLVGHVSKVVATGRQMLMMITYHYSKGDPGRGCAGFHYRTQDARAHTFRIRDQVQILFGGAGSAGITVYPLVCGFETDEDALMLHAPDGRTLSMADLHPDETEHLPRHLAALLPDMPTRMRDDLLPLLRGNLAHIHTLRGRVRTLDIEHREWVICLGRGFDWLHTPNLALIIGPYSPNLEGPILQAAGIIRANMRAGRIPDDGFLLLTSVPYEEVGVDRARAVLKSSFMSRFAAEAIAHHQPEQVRKMTVRSSVLNWGSRSLELLGPDDVLIEQDMYAEDAARRIADAAVAGLGRVDILVNNAGGSRSFKELRVSEEQWQEAITLNFHRPRQLGDALIDQMIAGRWGRIINITGKSEPEHINGAFCAKAGMHSWAKGLSRMVGPHGITVNCIPPGRIHSEQIFRNYTPEYRQWQCENEIPAGRYGEPEDLANLVCFLSSPLASYITGTVIPVDGGLRRYQF